MGWRRIVVVGDLHGLYREAVGLLSHAGVVAEGGRWCGEGVCLVFLGDVCDRGYDSASLYRAIQRWQGEARGYESRVVFLVGNHEALNLAGISPYMTLEEMEGYVKGDEDPRVAVRRAFGKGGWVRDWLEQQHVVVKVGPYVFGHGDVPVGWEGVWVEEGDAWVMGQVREVGEVRGVEELGAWPGLFDEARSVLWCRDAQMGEEEAFVDRLASFLERNGGVRYICGHTPQQDGRFFLGYEDRYLCVDTGMVYSRLYGVGGLSYLLIEEGRGWGVYLTDEGEERELVFDDTSV